MSKERVMSHSPEMDNSKVHDLIFEYARIADKYGRRSSEALRYLDEYKDCEELRTYAGADHELELAVTAHRWRRYFHKTVASACVVFLAATSFVCFIGLRNGRELASNVKSKDSAIQLLNEKIKKEESNTLAALSEVERVKAAAAAAQETHRSLIARGDELQSKLQELVAIQESGVKERESLRNQLSGTLSELKVAQAQMALAQKAELFKAEAAYAPLPGKGTVSLKSVRTVLIDPILLGYAGEMAADNLFFSKDGQALLRSVLFPEGQDEFRDGLMAEEHFVLATACRILRETDKYKRHLKAAREYQVNGVSGIVDLELRILNAAPNDLEGLLQEYVANLVRLSAESDQKAPGPEGLVGCYGSKWYCMARQSAANLMMQKIATARLAEILRDADSGSLVKPKKDGPRLAPETTSAP